MLKRYLVFAAAVMLSYVIGCVIEVLWGQDILIGVLTMYIIVLLGLLIIFSVEAEL